MKKIYLSGPVYKGSNHNGIDFQGFKTKLESLGYEVATPIQARTAEFDHDPCIIDVDQKLELRSRIKLMLGCDHIISMENWHQDKISIIEIDIARKVDIPVSHFTVINNLAPCNI